MEVRARAGKNVGKTNFPPQELKQILYGCGDYREPLDETLRVVDEIATEFIQGLSFEASVVATHAGRQKLKYEDFEFAMRKSPRLLGRAQEAFDVAREIKRLRKMEGMTEGYTELAAVAGEAPKGGAADRGKTGRPSKKRKTGNEPAVDDELPQPVAADIPVKVEDEELGEMDDDFDV